MCVLPNIVVIRSTRHVGIYAIGN